MPSSLSVSCRFAECQIAECHFAYSCHFAECQITEFCHFAIARGYAAYEYRCMVDHFATSQYML